MDAGARPVSCAKLPMTAAVYEDLWIDRQALRLSH
jgi:hypothetical protein